MKVTLLASSSSGDCHAVDFSDDSGSLRVFCHCEAGSFQQMCKHKLALLKGDRTMLYDRDQEKVLTEVLSSPAYPALKRRLDEREMDKLKDHAKTLKKDLAYELTHGHPKGYHAN